MIKTSQYEKKKIEVKKNLQTLQRVDFRLVNFEIKIIAEFKFFKQNLKILKKK